MMGTIEAFCLRKMDRREGEESEDAIASSVPFVSVRGFRGGKWHYFTRFEGNHLRLAVSDGISVNSYETRYWANSLVEHFAAQGMAKQARLSEWLEAAQEHWKIYTDGIEPIDSFEARQKLQGAGATLLGVEIEDSRYRIFGVGDSYAFHIRKNEIHKVFPKVAERADFAIVLTSSDLEYNGKVEKMLSEQPEDFFAEDVLLKGDVLFLMTDALAYGFLAKPDARLFQKMGARRSIFGKSFWQYCQESLKQGHLIDDDLTFMRVSFG
jgi:hypothetical protein